MFIGFALGELFGLLVKEKGFGEDKARFFFRQLVEGVKCCHEQGICHRDLKVSVRLADVFYFAAEVLFRAPT